MSTSMESPIWFNGITVAEQPWIEIVRQPQSVYRMRYETDDRKTNLFAEELELKSASSPSLSNDSMSVAEDNDSSDLPCSSKSQEKETKKRRKDYVKVKVHNLNDPSYLLVCCVSADEPYLCHPNMLVGRNCENGVYITRVDRNSNNIELKDIRIQLVKKDQLNNRLSQLKQLKIDDPFLVKNYSQKPESIDLGKIRLCFQILDHHPFANSFTPYPPVLSKPISTSKQKLSILIQYTSEMSGLMSGGNQIALLVKKLEKDQKPIIARFYDNHGWVKDVCIERVHYQCALLVTVPPYKLAEYHCDVQVNLKLFACPDKKDKSSSPVPVQFKYESNNVIYTYKSYVSSSNVMLTLNN